MRKKAENWKNNRERGVALLFALFTLLLISAIAVSLVFMTNTETSVNSNYRMERVSAFAAKAGAEEARDRMVAFNNNAQLPLTLPPLAGSVLYVLNEGTAPGTVKPWVVISRECKRNSRHQTFAARHRRTSRRWYRGRSRHQ